MSLSVTSAASALERLKAPAEDGGVLLLPRLEHWPVLAQANRRSAGEWRFDLLDVDVQTVRAQTRQGLVGPSQADSTIIAMGHQPDFIHPGVWAKDVATHQAATLAGGVGVYLLADSDATQAIHLRVPHLVGDHLHITHLPVTDTPSGRSYEDLPALSGKQVTRLAEGVCQALGETGFKASSMPTFLEALRSVPANGNWVEQMARGRQVFDRLAELELVDRPVSAVWGGPLALHLLLDAGRFAEAYNRALAEHRQRQGIRGRRHPIPDLAIAADGLVESPMWHYLPGQPRRRVFVAQRGDEVILRAGHQKLATLPRGRLARWSTAGRLLGEPPLNGLRPRALTLTMWARLLGCDLFVQGIGGARYDAITDRVMAGYFGIAPPAFACASATLRLNFPRHPASERDLHQARRRQRDLQFNPQRYLSDPAGVARLVSERASAIAQAQRLRRDDHRNHPARRAAFLRIRAANQELLAREPSLAARLADELAQRLCRHEHERLAEARDYFVGFFSPQRLRELAERVRGRGG